MSYCLHFALLPRQSQATSAQRHKDKASGGAVYPRFPAHEHYVYLACLTLAMSFSKLSRRSALSLRAEVVHARPMSLEQYHRLTDTRFASTFSPAKEYWMAPRAVLASGTDETTRDHGRLVPVADLIYCISIYGRYRVISLIL